ncbi:MAG: hypothetical protein GC165_16870 [Armatimonadetes bacterium]|nr:hypothetical protein [Armatimonadota bacterium]
MKVKLLTLSIFTVCASYACADVIIDTYTGPNGGVGDIGWIQFPNTPPEYFDRAFSITSSFTLDDITINMFGTEGLGFKMLLRADNSGHLGDTICSFSGTLVGNQHDFTFSTPSHPLIIPGTYHLLVGGVPYDSHSQLSAWTIASDNHMADFYFADDTDITGGPSNILDTTLRITGSPVPETSAAFAITFGSLALAISKRKKQSRV